MQVVYESAVERTLQGVRSRAAFASGSAPKVKGRGKTQAEGEAPSRREPTSAGHTLLTAADEVQLAKKIQVRQCELACAHGLFLTGGCHTGPALAGAHADGA